MNTFQDKSIRARQSRLRPLKSTSAYNFNVIYYLQRVLVVVQTKDQPIQCKVIKFKQTFQLYYYYSNESEEFAIDNTTVT